MFTVTEIQNFCNEAIDLKEKKKLQNGSNQSPPRLQLAFRNF